LRGRTQSVLINNTESTTKPLKYGVPQGSKLGPILFNAYIAPLSQIAEDNNIKDQKYADDEQLILSFKPGIQAQNNAARKMEKCIQEIRNFLHQNKLSNNADKTEFIIIGSSHNLQQMDFRSINVDESAIINADRVKNLGVIFDNSMKMDQQVNEMCKKSFFNIRNIAQIRKSLNKDDAKTAVHALVTPHLDCGNALLVGTSSKNIKKLQVAQNSAARLIARLKKYDRISHVRKELHWLPITARIEFKILNLTWKVLNNEAPGYLKELLNTTLHNRNTRSTNSRCLEKVRCNNNFGMRAFSVVAPKLWNDLPINVRNSITSEMFKSRLKTHLFQKSYNVP
jgi:hypothetical protein